jgi:hypothetical protein
MNLICKYFSGRLFIAAAAMFFCTGAAAQLKHGIYKSTPDSFEPGYYLIVTKDSITLLGKIDKGIHIKSAIPNSHSGRLTFTGFEYSYESPDYKKPDEFKNNPSISGSEALINRYFFNFENDGSGYQCQSVKDVYQDRADSFRFEKIE